MGEIAGNEKTEVDLEQVDGGARAAKTLESEPEPEYPRAIVAAGIASAICFAILLVALDESIVATAVPRITDQFNSLNDVAWYGAVYMLTYGSLQLPFGTLYTYFNIKYSFITAVAVFALGSVVAGAAPSSEALIIGRAISGLGCAGIASGGSIILTYTVPVRQRPIYMGMVGAIFGIASVAGPLVGGALTDHVSWRWCFYVNLPVGGFSIGLILITLTEPYRPSIANMTFKEKISKFHTVSLLTFLPGIVCLLLALQWGDTIYPWGSPRIIALLVVSGVLITSFIVLQYYRQDLAMIPSQVLKQRSILFGSASAFTTGAGYLPVVYLIPVWAQAVKGLSAMDSGLRLIPLIVGVAIFAVLSGIATATIGYYVPWMTFGGVLSSTGAGLLTTLNPKTTFSRWMGYQFLLGSGVGMTLQQPMVAAQTVLKTEDVAIGMALIIFFQTLGSSVGLPVFQAIMMARLGGHGKGGEGATKVVESVPEEAREKMRELFSDALTES